VDGSNIDTNMWVGASALAERLWADMPLGANKTRAAADAEKRHHALQV
jgi:hypothetical protein